MRRYNEVTQCIAFSRCQYLELCVPSNDAVVRKWNVKDDSEPLNVACCIMEKKSGSCSEICWWSFPTELQQRILRAT